MSATQSRKCRKCQARDAHRRAIARTLAVWCVVLAVFLLVTALMNPVHFLLAGAVAAYAIYQVRRMGQRARRNMRRRH